jgi:hypothetical protein
MARSASVHAAGRGADGIQVRHRRVRAVLRGDRAVPGDRPPLILLAQNRQDERDRANIERDRAVAARTQADTEYLARELAAVRLALDDVVTVRDLEDSLSRLEKLITDRSGPGHEGHEGREGPED